ncbi:MAG: ABC transporter substrate-binding protein [Solirubrobacteraceae bacterium]
MRAASSCRRSPAAIALIAGLISVLLGACGPRAPGPGLRDASLVLDFTPNAIHAGIYEAIARGYDRHAGVALHVIAPSASTDAIKLLLTGRTEFAILDIHDLAIARAEGQQIVAIMAIVQRPLASVIAAPQFASPRQLEGQLVGVTGDPSDLAVLRSIVAGAGGEPDRVRTITIGFDAVPDLLSHRVAAATAFWNDEGVTLAHVRPGYHVFRVEDYGAPPYPELLLCATVNELRSDPSLARAVVGALVRGYEAVLRNPQSGERAIESLVPGLSLALVAEQLHAELPAFLPQTGGVGGLDPATLGAWARWEVRFGIVKRKPDLAAMFNRGFLPR